MRAIPLLYLSLLVQLIQAQNTPAYIPIDDKKTKPVESMYIDQNGELVYLSIEKYMGFAQAGLAISKWNGLFTATYPVFNPDLFYYGDNNHMALCLMDDTLFAAASFIASGSRSGIVQWDGTKWSGVGGGIWSDYAIHQEISIEELFPFQSRLYACGTFNQIQSGPTSGFVVLNSGVWQDIPVDGKVLDLEQIGDTLFAAGSFTNLNGIASNNICMLVNGNWQALANPNIGAIRQLGKLGRQLIAIGESGVSAYKSGVWTPLNNNWQFTIETKGSTAELNGLFYLSGVIKHSDGSQHHLLQWDGITWQSILKKEDLQSDNGKRFLIASNGKSLYFAGNLKKVKNETVYNIIEIFPNNTIVKGKLYKDNNQNCIYDAGDAPIANAIISIDQDNYFTSTNEKGDYQVALTPNIIHHLQVFPENNEAINCGMASIQILTGSRDSQIIRDFVFIDKPLPPGEFIHLQSENGYKVKHGYDANYQIDFNLNAHHFPFILTLKHPSYLNGFHSEQATIENKDGSISWAIETPESITFSFNINPIHYNLGDVLDFEVEAHRADNWSISHQMSQTVVSAYDPNDKQCNELRIGTGARSLDYRIGFQNLGNDDAINVYVVDTISRSIPLQYLKVRNYSHANNYAVSFKVKDHAVVWGFNEIHLGAKSVVGDELSSGFINFNCGLENNLQIGDSITNQAAIYFDFQAPVFTNRVVTKVVTHTQPGNQLGLNLILYPNPNAGSFTLNLEPYDIQKVDIYDLNGRLIGSYEGLGSGKLLIETSGLSEGVYMVRVQHALGVITRQFVILQE